MEKKRLFKIMAKADGEIIAKLSEKIKERHEIVVIKMPGKTLTMIQMREPVKNSLFYIGEVMVCEAMVELDGTKGMAVTMGDDFDKTLDMAVIDAACNKGVFYDEAALLELERAQVEQEERENALHLRTMVNFTSMDQEAAV
ncbi:MAG TPA: phosphonate C-P lyase system protein PhnG [Anaerovoracaceae bacterium]|nr:phosphonate C-P lyase system protein PhnG [Anaerovoracaceae bacterium]